MNKISTPESEHVKNTDITLREDYRYPTENTAIKFVLYCDDLPTGKSYSIQSVKYVNGEKVCQATAPDVSTNADFAFEMYRKIVYGEVDPVTLRDVVYDLLP